MTLFKRWAPPEDAAEAAAWWLSLKHSPRWTRARQVALEAWLARSPANLAAFERAQQAFGAAALLAAEPRLLAVRERALSMPPERSFSRYSIAAGVVGAVFLGLMTATTFWSLGFGAMERHENAHGARSTLRLADGSRVDLNGDSAIDVRITGRRRTVRLLKGEAWFDVADDKRPFKVEAGGRTITDIGTSFDVRVVDRAVHVAVSEGRVAVAAGKKTPTEIGAGQLLVSQPDGEVQVRRLDVAALGDWRYGRVQFAGAPLREAVAEMNRYSASPIRVGDPSLDGLKVSGVFFTDGASGFLKALTTHYGVEVRVGDRGDQVLVAGQGAPTKKM